MNCAVLLTLLPILFITFAHSHKILAVLPFPSKSHYAIPDPLMVRLAELGHQVTVYSPYPKAKSIPNYTEHDVSECFKIPDHILSMDSMHNMMSNSVKSILTLFKFTTRYEVIASCKPFMELLNTTEKYDLFVTEVFNSDSMLLFVQKFRIPFIIVIPNIMTPWLSNRMGSPDNPSYVPTLFSEVLPGMSFYERALNAFTYAFALLSYEWLSMKESDDISRRILGTTDPLSEVVKNTSLLFINSHTSINAVVPLVPNVVQIAGIHIKEARTIPKNIEKFINESEHGVVYFCMGSLLRGESFPEEKRNAFLDAFEKIPQRVLWKWEGDVLPGKTDKIMISKWMPQRDILAHPKVKLFISHGGLLGTSEAVYEGVPILGIPIFGDQRTNVKAIEANGAGELLDYNDITKETVLEKIKRLINDPKYKENADALSFRYKDRPMSPLDTAVYWTEYVIRHKGAHHLKTAAVNMPWYQYLLLDVIAFVLVTIIIVLAALYYSIKITLRYIIRRLFGINASKKSKVKSN